MAIIAKLRSEASLPSLARALSVPMISFCLSAVHCGAIWPRAIAAERRTLTWYFFAAFLPATYEVKVSTMSVDPSSTPGRPILPSA